ncbi:MAG: UDP-glucose 4-epimerase GalE [Desulfovibrio sp.]|jgi:UDP-glucose-4-epimerase GalE|nr:UDP-glucose 4-epimerase GalE [Desulfovibrio sp.]
MAETILVTGGAGYIGSHISKALALSGYVPVVYDNLLSGHRELVRWGEFVHGDICDYTALSLAMRCHNISGVVHCAALAYVGESIANPDAYYHTNVTGPLNVLRAMQACGVSKIVVSSSCAVYGHADGAPITEDTPLQPISPYGFTKFVMERMLDDFDMAYSVRSAALRYFNAAGADADADCGEWHTPETHLVPRIVMTALGRIPELHIFGNDYPTPDGTCIRDYVHVTDIAQAHVNAMRYLSEGKPSCKVNLGTGRGYSIKELVDAAEAMFQKKIPCVIHPRRAGDPAALVADARYARTLLQWMPVCSSLDAILATGMRFTQSFIGHD